MNTYISPYLLERLGFKIEEIEEVQIGETTVTFILKNDDHTKTYFYTQLIAQDGKLEPATC